MSAMASCSSSLALSRGHRSLSSFHMAGKLDLRPPSSTVSFRFNQLGLKWRRMNYVVACSEADSPKAVVADAVVEAPGVQPRRKRGRPKKEATDEEEEWEFFGELARHLQHGAPSEQEEHPTVEVASEKTKNAAAGNSIESNEMDGSSSSVPEAAATSPSLFQEEEISREEDIDSDNIDLDDPKYQQKPDWMQDSVWESINNQLADDDEGQALWVDEDDPSWPAEEPEDGWGFRTSQFFDKVSIKNDKSSGDDEDDEELRMNWENEADDWMIQEITSSDWELCVLHNPSPLVVYVFARYGRRGLDSWKTLEQLENAVTKIWESNKAPLRAVKVDIGMEIDLGSALGIGKDECPQLLFIKNGKGLYRLQEQRTSEELVQLMAHFFYNGAKPACLKTTSSPENFESVG